MTNLDLDDLGAFHAPSGDGQADEYHLLRERTTGDLFIQRAYTYAAGHSEPIPLAELEAELYDAAMGYWRGLAPATPKEGPMMFLTLESFTAIDADVRVAQAEAEQAAQQWLHDNRHSIELISVAPAVTLMAMGGYFYVVTMVYKEQAIEGELE